MSVEDVEVELVLATEAMDMDVVPDFHATLVRTVGGPAAGEDFVRP
jgi:hypothetical protein